MDKQVILHIGCGRFYIEGFINSDKSTHSIRGGEYKLDLVMELSDPWPYEDGTVDGVVSMGVLQQLHWRDLIKAFKESYRVLRDGGIMRMGVTAIEMGKPVDYILGWNNVNMFSYSLLEEILTKHIGFKHCWNKKYKDSNMKELTKVDNQPEQLIYVEVQK